VLLTIFSIIQNAVRMGNRASKRLDAVMKAHDRTVKAIKAETKNAQYGPLQTEQDCSGVSLIRGCA
jgi:hypothetical protein